MEPELWIQRIRRNSKNAKGYVPTVDIFVMDNTPDNIVLQKFKIIALKILQGMLKDNVNYENFSIFYKAALAITFYLGKIFTRKFKLRLYDWISQIGNKKDTKYDSYLTAQYGDYMTPPKESERKPGHI